jgi:SAM-dependent methyltransferase
MKWLAKAAAYKVLSALPGGPAMYQYCRERITKSLVPTGDRLGQKIDVALKYYDWLANNGMSGRLIDGVHVDFGAGWHPTIPLVYYCLGTDRQHLLDVAVNTDAHLVQQTVSLFLELVTDPQRSYRAKVRRLPPRLGDSNWRAYLERLGIIYHAPCGEALAALEGGVDVITSTQVLLHVPRSAMLECLSQIHASLKPGGLFLVTVHLRDILAGNPHNSADKYKALRYSPGTWDRWINCSIMSFNRFKAPDYREMLEKAGFEILHFEVDPATAEDYAELDRTHIDRCFQHYTREDLAARGLFFVAQRR